MNSRAGNSSTGSLPPTGTPGFQEDLRQAIEERIGPLPTARLGVLLRELRESKRLSLRDVALVPELRSELEDIEAGRCRPDATHVAVFLNCYGAYLDELVPPREMLTVVEGTDGEVLTHYLGRVRHWRGSAKHPELRVADSEVLAGVLGTDAESIRKRLQTQAVEERVAPLSTARLRFLVKRLRDSARLPQDEFARLPELLRSNLEEVEAGRLRPDTALLEEVLNYCGAALDDLVPPRETLVVTAGTDKEVLTRYLNALRGWRGSAKHPPLRKGDLAVLAGMLGSDPREIQRRLRKLTGCSRRRARQLTVLLLAGMVLAPGVASLLHSSGTPATANMGTEVHPSETQLASAAGTAAAYSLAAVSAESVQTVPPHATVAVQTVAVQSAGGVHTVAVQSDSAVRAVPVKAPAAVPVKAPTAVSVHTVAADCATALAYLTAHAKPGFAHYCRPGNLKVGITNAVAYTCVPGPSFACPDGRAEIIIADPACAATYENEASNSYWDFSTGTIIHPGATQDGRTWDPYGGCP